MLFYGACKVEKVSVVHTQTINICESLVFDCSFHTNKILPLKPKAKSTSTMEADSNQPGLTPEQYSKFCAAWQYWSDLDRCVKRANMHVRVVARVRVRLRVRVSVRVFALCVFLLVRYVRVSSNGYVRANIW